MNILNGVNTIARAAGSSQKSLEEKVRAIALTDTERAIKIYERVERFYSFKRKENPSASLIALETLRLSLKQGISWANTDAQRIRRLERAFWKKVKDGSLFTWEDITPEQVESMTPEMINFWLANAVVTRKLPKNFLKKFIKSFLGEINFN